MKSLHEISVRAQDFIIDEAFINLDELIDLLHSMTDRADKLSLLKDIYRVQNYIEVAIKKREKFFAEKGV